jgi:hypothetical protein
MELRPTDIGYQLPVSAQLFGPFFVNLPTNTGVWAIEANIQRQQINASGQNLHWLRQADDMA